MGIFFAKFDLLSMLFILQVALTAASIDELKNDGFASHLRNDNVITPALADAIQCKLNGKDVHAD